MPAIIAAVPTARSEARNVGPNDDNTMMKYYYTPPSAVDTRLKAKSDPQIENPEDFISTEDRVGCWTISSRRRGRRGGW